MSDTSSSSLARMDLGKIEIHGASERNLRGVSVAFPKGQLTAVCGPSGSGKSALVFDVLARSAFNRFLLPLGLSRAELGDWQPVKVIDVSGTSLPLVLHERFIRPRRRDTLATITGLSALITQAVWAMGVEHCAQCGNELYHLTPQQVASQLTRVGTGVSLILAPFTCEISTDYLESLLKLGATRLLWEGKRIPIEQAIPVVAAGGAYEGAEIFVDAISLPIREGESSWQRTLDSLNFAIQLGQGRGIFRLPSETADGEFGVGVYFGAEPWCSSCCRVVPALSKLEMDVKKLGACHCCEGAGSEWRLTDCELNVVDSCPIIELPNRLCGRGSRKINSEMWAAALRSLGFTGAGLFSGLTPDRRRLLISGELGERSFRLSDLQVDSAESSFSHPLEASFIRKYGAIRAFLACTASDSKRMPDWFDLVSVEVACSLCAGSRCSRQLGFMRLGRAGISVDAMLTRKIGDLIGPLTELQVSTDSELGCRLLRVILARLSALCELELQHLSLTRSAKSLSQGEFRRAVLVSNLGGAFSRLLYLVDEPTIGLDSIGVETVLAFLRNLVTQGHTVITVEHDEFVISNSDYIIELGTGGGPFGGKVVFQGLPEQRIQVGVKSDLETAQLVAEQPPSPPAATLKARGVSKYNLPPRDIDLQINRLTVLSGSSGSGKSTTIMDCLASAIRRSNQRRNASNRRDLGAAELALLGIGSLEGADQFNRVICCEGLPSGVSNRTSVASMIGVFNPILELYAKTSEGRIRGLGLRELRRAVVSGDEATLGSIKFRGWSLTAVLQLSIGEARGLFGRIPSISKCLSIASDVGLDYLCLSDRAIDCSVGEQQRMRLVEPLSTKKMEKTLLLLDEPSCGLGAAEVIKLISTIRRTIRDGATVLVIEHHPLFIAAGDVHIRF